MRLFLSNGLPVLIETWLELHPNDGMGHYRLLTGYDDAEQMWIVYDSYVSQGLKKGDPYQGILLPYADVGSLWRVFDDTYLLVYRDKQAPLVAAVLGADADEALARQRGLALAQATVDAQPAGRVRLVQPGERSHGPRSVCRGRGRIRSGAATGSALAHAVVSVWAVCRLF